MSAGLVMVTTIPGILYGCWCQRTIKKRPWQIFSICQGRVKLQKFSRGTTLLHENLHALTGYTSYPWQLTYVLTSMLVNFKLPYHRILSVSVLLQILLCKIIDICLNLLFTLPSVAHLTICVLSGSQHPGLSVSASIALTSTSSV